MYTWSTLFLYACTTAAVSEAFGGGVHDPIKFISLNATESANRMLKPLLMNTNGTSISLEGLVRREDPLAALLARQSCPAGNIECTSPVGTCCPFGGDCCSSTTCCDAGSLCCSSGGCCSLEDYCAVADGQRGCCPIGETCTALAGQCSRSGYSPCPGESKEFCCPIGETCFRDGANQVRCKSGSGGGAVVNPAQANYKITIAVVLATLLTFF